MVMVPGSFTEADGHDLRLHSGEFEVSAYLFEVLRHRLADDEAHGGVTCGGESCGGTQREHADIATAIDDQIGMEGIVESVDVVHAEFARAVVVALQLGGADVGVDEPVAAPVLDCDAAVFDEGLQQGKKQSPKVWPRERTLYKQHFEAAEGGADTQNALNVVEGHWGGLTHDNLIFL